MSESIMELKKTGDDSIREQNKTSDGCRNSKKVITLFSLVFSSGTDSWIFLDGWED